MCVCRELNVCTHTCLCGRMSGACVFAHGHGSVCGLCLSLSWLAVCQYKCHSRHFIMGRVCHIHHYYACPAPSQFVSVCSHFLILSVSVYKRQPCLQFNALGSIKLKLFHQNLPIKEILYICDAFLGPHVSVRFHLQCLSVT